MAVLDNPHPRRVHRGRPTVAGVAGGVGTTTVAAALGAVDRGVVVGRGVDILVCRATGDSLVRAGRAAQLVAAATGRRPVIVVTAADAGGACRPTTARLRLLEPHASAIVALPFVRRWRELAAPLDEARTLLRLPLGEVPRPLRRYAGALHDLVSALDARPSAPARPDHARPATTSTVRRTR